MSSKISADISTLEDIHRKLDRFLEEIAYNLRSVKSTIESAEFNGWNDPQYHSFVMDFASAEHMIKEGMRQIEENLLPQLKRYISHIESL